MPSNITAQQYAKKNKEFRYWRIRTLYSIMIGYTLFYIVRQNFSYAVPSLCNELDITKSAIGSVMSVGAILYGMGRFLFGLVGDRYSARYVMAIGLAGSGTMNIFLGTSSWFPTIILCFSLNQCFQSMGSPPCAKMLANWFGKSELGSKWGIWNISLHIGGASAGILSPWLIEHFGWRYVFYVPSIAAIAASIIIFNRLRDTPKSMGFPSIDEIEGSSQKVVHSNLNFKETAKLTLTNKVVWIMGFANFFIYIDRMTFINWGPTLLQEGRGSSSFLSGHQMALFDLAGILGTVLAGYISDKFVSNGKVATATLCVIGSIAMNGAFFCIPQDSAILTFICMAGLGALMTAPITLINAFVSELVNKKTVATAIGLIGTMGYIGSAVSGIGIASIVENFGWNAVVIFTMISSLLASLLFSFMWYKCAYFTTKGK